MSRRRHTRNPLAWLAAVLVVARERRERRRRARQFIAYVDQVRRQYDQRPRQP